MFKTASTLPTFTDQLNDSIHRACEWLQTMNVEGGYRSGQRPSRDKPNELAIELDPVSVLASGYATHLYAWLWHIRIVRNFSDQKENTFFQKRAHEAADWLTNRWALHLMLSDDVGSPQRFYDLGIAGRALFAAFKSLHRPDYWDVAIAIGARMVDFQTTRGVNHAVLPIDETLPADWSNQPGAYQLKPAMLWKIVQRIAEYEDLGLHWFNAAPPPKVHVSRKPTKESRQDQRQKVHDLHPFALHIEALLMSDNSSERAIRAMLLFQDRVALCEDWLRTDVLAQHIRLHLLTGGEQRSGPLKRLMSVQHSSGGFHFSHGAKHLSAELSTIATIFAVQAMVLAVNPALTKITAPFGRRDLSII